MESGGSSGMQTRPLAFPPAQLSDQSAVLSDISVTPQRIMTVGAAPPCVVLKRFISSRGLSSASLQVLNNSFFFFFWWGSQKRHRHTSASCAAVASLAVFFMMQADVLCLDNLRRLFVSHVHLLRNPPRFETADNGSLFGCVIFFCFVLSLL